MDSTISFFDKDESRNRKVTTAMDYPGIAPRGSEGKLKMKGSFIY